MPPQHHKWKWYFLGASIILFFAGTGALYFVKAAEPSSETATKFFELTSKNDVGGAYALMSTGYRDHVGMPEFIESLKGFAGIPAKTEFNATASDLAGIYEYVTGTITNTADNDTGRIEVKMVRENGQWKIDAIQLNP